MDELLKRFLEVGSLKFGDFVLSSGKRSNVYVDVKIASTFPDILEMIADAMAEKLKNVEFDRIACIELGGVPIATAVSLKMKKPLLIFRKEKKEHGLSEDMIGELKEGERVVVIEDVITTGKSALSVAKRVEEKGGKVVKILAVVDREEGDLKFESIIKLRDLIKVKNVLDSSKT
uniref:Orotate phosphoribosyltransferase n=1 Tax=Archaeoglobus fulgidus TaxID=2234 RepID=A0A7J2THW4_ARCFL